MDARVCLFSLHLLYVLNVLKMDQKPKYEAQVNHRVEKKRQTLKQKSSQWVMINLEFARFFNRLNICLTSERNALFCARPNRIPIEL